MPDIFEVMSGQLPPHWTKMKSAIQTVPSLSRQ